MHSSIRQAVKYCCVGGSQDDSDRRPQNSGMHDEPFVVAHSGDTDHMHAEGGRVGGLAHALTRIGDLGPSLVVDDLLVEGSSHTRMQHPYLDEGRIFSVRSWL
eukprot:6110039-Alexandrium_andersonii.AAC.1